VARRNAEKLHREVQADQLRSEEEARRNADREVQADQLRRDEDARRNADQAVQDDQILREKEAKRNAEEARAKVEADQLQKEKKEETECVICFENERNMVFVPCGHLCACETCVPTLRDNLCPICRKEGNFIRIYNV